MFPEPEVRERFEKMVLVKLYTDALRPPERRKKSEANQKLQIELTNSTTLPGYVVATSDGKPVKVMAFTQSKEQFLKFLDDGLAGAQ